jgi:hypothetical protein
MDNSAEYTNPAQAGSVEAHQKRKLSTYLEDDLSFDDINAQLPSTSATSSSKAQDLSASGKIVP